MPTRTLCDLHMLCHSLTGSVSCVSSRRPQWPWPTMGPFGHGYMPKDSSSAADIGALAADSEASAAAAKSRPPSCRSWQVPHWQLWLRFRFRAHSRAAEHSPSASPCLPPCSALPAPPPPRRHALVPPLPFLPPKQLFGRSQTRRLRHWHSCGRGRILTGLFIYKTIDYAVRPQLEEPEGRRLVRQDPCAATSGSRCRSMPACLSSSRRYGRTVQHAARSARAFLCRARGKCSLSGHSTRSTTAPRPHSNLSMRSPKWVSATLGYVTFPACFAIYLSLLRSVYC